LKLRQKNYKCQYELKVTNLKPITVEKMMVTPDPGVIEVNVHPAKTWQEIVDNTSALYEEALFMSFRNR
jgi:uncharacterized protein (DUF2126 family)